MTRNINTSDTIEITDFHDFFFKHHLPSLKKAFSRNQNRSQNKKVNQKQLILFMLLGITSLTFLFSSYLKNSKEFETISQFIKTSELNNTNVIANLIQLRSLINNNWYDQLDSSFVMKEKVDNLINNVLSRHLELNIVPILYVTVEEDMKRQLNSENIENFINSFRVYSMFHNGTGFDHDYFKEYYLSSYLLQDFNSRQLEEALININPVLLAQRSFQLNDELYLQAVARLNHPSVEKMFYNTMAKNMADKPLINLINTLPKHFFEIFDKKLYELSIPYIYSRKGYVETLSYQQEILRNATILAKYNKNVNLNNLKSTASAASSNYYNEYLSNYNHLLSEIKFKQLHRIDDALPLLKQISVNLHLVPKLFEQIDDLVLISGRQGTLGVMQNEIFEKTKDFDSTLSNYLNEDYINLIPLKNRLSPEILGELAKNIKEVTKFITEISVATDINEICFEKALIFEKSDGDSPLKRAMEFSLLLPTPLDSIYNELINNLQFLLYKHASKYINSQWRILYDFYSEKIYSLYPFSTDNNTNYIDLKDFSNFFTKDGMLDNFISKYLVLKNLNVSGDGRQLLEYANSIKTHWFNEEGKLQIQFNIIPIKIDSNLQQLNLLIAGNRTTFTHDQLEAYSVIWPNPKQISGYAEAEFINNKNHRYGRSYPGVWSWYKLLELDKVHGHIAGSSTLSNCVLRSPFGDFEFVINFSNHIPLLDINKLKLLKQIVLEL
jgi:type VI protein secretion system component VasK